MDYSNHCRPVFGKCFLWRVWHLAFWFLHIIYSPWSPFLDIVVEWKLNMWTNVPLPPNRQGLGCCVVIVYWPYCHLEPVHAAELCATARNMLFSKVRPSLYPQRETFLYFIRLGWCILLITSWLWIASICSIYNLRGHSRWKYLQACSPGRTSWAIYPFLSWPGSVESPHLFNQHSE